MRTCDVRLRAGGSGALGALVARLDATQEAIERANAALLNEAGPLLVRLFFWVFLFGLCSEGLCLLSGNGEWETVVFCYEAGISNCVPTTPGRCSCGLIVCWKHLRMGTDCFAAL